jgi:ubiquinone/menaquinone biosynthesis C-methylase UbiE
MTEEQIRFIANQLRQPEGESGIVTGKKMNEGNALMNRTMIDLLKPVTGEVLLEVGMGNGYFVPQVLQLADSLTYIGCDFSEVMVKEAAVQNENIVKEGNAKFYLASADRLPVADGTIDKIFTLNTIYFWPDVKAVFEEFQRVLKPGGKIFIGIRPKSVMENYPFTRFGFVMYEKDDLINLIETHGFRVETAFENDEPELEMGGKKFKVASLIVAAIKK